ncbi:MAG: hypothetical protein IPK79_12775 [Vampirovibrionales bacterium]|nr:hypothetical protein [Vampirovibrionales bacterium]
MAVAVSSLVLFLIALGLVFRRKRRAHVALMLSAFALDFGLVLAIELNRHAVEQALGGVHGLLLFHIIISTLVLAFYGALIVSGINWIKGKPWAFRWHRWLAAVFLLLRLLNYVTSLYIG